VKILYQQCYFYDCFSFFFSSRLGEISMFTLFSVPVCLYILLCCMYKFSIQHKLWYVPFIVGLLPGCFI